MKRDRHGKLFGCFVLCLNSEERGRDTNTKEPPRWGCGGNVVEERHDI